MSCHCDVSDEDQVKALVAKTIERFGKIDILVNNAALFAPLHHTKVQDIDVDAVGQGDRGQCARLVPDGEARRVPHMIARKYGKIINIGSGTVYKGIPDMLALHCLQGRDRDVDAHAVARARRARHLRQHAGAGSRHERDLVANAALTMQRCRRAWSAAAPSSATRSRRICWAR